MPPITKAFIKEEPKDGDDHHAEESQIIKSTVGPIHHKATAYRLVLRSFIPVLTTTITSASLLSVYFKGSDDLGLRQSTETSSTDRTLRSRSKNTNNSTMTNGKTTGRQIVTEKLNEKKRIRGNEKHQVIKIIG